MHHLPTFLDEVDPTEAVDYVLPLLIGLAVDEGVSRLFFLFSFLWNGECKGMKETWKEKRTRSMTSPPFRLSPSALLSSVA